MSAKLSALDVIGGQRPVTPQGFGVRAANYHGSSGGNMIKELMDVHSYEEMPPVLGIFNDVSDPASLFHLSYALARNGFFFSINDGEHASNMMLDYWQTEMLQAKGIVSGQRVWREAVSQSGDALLKGNRFVVAPYRTSVEDIELFFQSITYPEHGLAGPHARGGCGTLRGDGTRIGDTAELRAAEDATQGWPQFEFEKMITDEPLRDRALEYMVQHRNRATGLIGTFDFAMTAAKDAELMPPVYHLLNKARDKKVHMGIIVGGKDEDETTDNMCRAMENGARVIVAAYFTSALAQVGAERAAAPFFRAAEKMGF